MTNENWPYHVGICTGTKQYAGRYVITAEYLDGFVVLAAYPTVARARHALARWRQRYPTRPRTRASWAEAEDDGSAD